MADDFSDSDSDSENDSKFLISSKTKNLCLIFNFRKYDNEKGISKGKYPKHDVEAIKNTFEECLYFETSVHTSIGKIGRNGSGKLLDDFSKQDYSKYSCIAIFVMHNGSYETIQLKDNSNIPTGEFIEKIIANQSLKNKPKLIFINTTPTTKLENLNAIISNINSESENRKFSPPNLIRIQPFNVFHKFHFPSLLSLQPLPRQIREESLRIKPTLSNDCTKKSLSPTPTIMAQASSSSSLKNVVSDIDLSESNSHHEPISSILFPTIKEGEKEENKNLIKKTENLVSKVPAPVNVIKRSSSVSKRADEKINYKLFTDPEIYIFYSTNQGKIWFFENLCNVLKNCKDRYDLLRITTEAIKLTRRAIPKEDGFVITNPNLAFHCTLSKPLVFKTILNELDNFPERGRYVVLNYSKILNFFRFGNSNQNVFIKNINYKLLNHKNTKTILETEFKNDTTNCSSLVVIILAKCENQAFLTKEGSNFKIKDVLEYFKSSVENFEKHPKYTFINSSNLPNANFFPLYYCNQYNGVFFSYNTWPNNHTIQVINNYNCFKLPSISIKTQAVNTNGTNGLNLFRHCINSSMNHNYSINHLNHLYPIKEFLYDTKGVSNGQCFIMDYRKVTSEEMDIIEETFEECLKFSFEKLKQVTSLKNILKDLKNNCVIIFLYAELENNDMIKWQGDKKYQINEIIENLSAKNLNGKPKLLFIQNLSIEKAYVNFDFELRQDVLLVINPENNKEVFFKSFCELLKEHFVELDLMSILLKCNIETGNSLSIKSTLTKTLFFKKILSNMEITTIKNDDLFYKRTKGKCQVMKYDNDPYGHLFLELFRKLGFDTSYQIADDKVLQKMLDNDMFQNFSKYDSFFLFFLVDEASNIEIIHKLIDHLTNVESLFGKPKVIFILGKIQYERKPYKQKPADKLYDYKVGDKITKHADILIFHSQDVLLTMLSLRKVFTSENTEKYDLMSLLLMVSDDVKHEKLLSKYRIKSNKRLKIETNNDPININSTLRRLFLLRKEDNKIVDSDFILSRTNNIIRKGKCIIFNYENYDDDEKNRREGTEIDRIELADTFEKLGFDVAKLDSDLTKSQTKDAIENIECDDCLVVCFLTHGNENNQLKTSDGYINLDQIVIPIAQNLKLAHIPKFFIFQACRGSNFEIAHDFGNFRPDNLINETNFSLAMYPNLFAFFPTINGHYSWRSETEGSYFIQTLCKLLKERCNEYDIFTIASIVIRKVSSFDFIHTIDKDKESKRVLLAKQTPTFTTTFLRPYSFFKDELEETNSDVPTGEKSITL